MCAIFALPDVLSAAAGRLKQGRSLSSANSPLRAPIAHRVSERVPALLEA